ncbi:hypothetical protein A4G99_06550 [Haladaptatus sp. R4]|uniref:hypothetical protein n=1 Tax=Haladaptatus sp. R4 TaxID=1679489 RepID=UPI0007B4D8D2|nr:hypothetical protein [Haladaptatus sp. R4]KZN24107.1 hypothetical protein A4G99_06550 [Haladaptatus sp. R4]
MRVTPPDIAVPDGRNGGRVIALIGILLSIVVVIDPLVRSGSVWFPEFIIEMTLSAMLIYVGYRLTRSDIDAKTLQKVDVSCFKGMLALGGFAAGVIVTAKVSGWHISNPYFLVQTMVTSGALLGLVIGVAGMVAPLRTGSKGGASNESSDNSNTSGTGAGSTNPSGSTDLPNSTGSADSNDPRTPFAADADSAELPAIPEGAIATDGLQAPSGVVDDWLEVLADRNCRYVLRMAMNAPDGVLTIDELTATDELRKRSLETNLRHITLPKLWDLHLIDYDDRTGTIRYDSNPAFEELFETVERYRQ